MSIKSKTGFSGKLLYINKVEMDSRAEISINKFYQGMITLYRVSRDIVNLVREEINQYLVIELEEGEMITAVGLNFKSASGGMDNCFKLELQADILFKGERAYTNTSKFQEIRFEITEGNELIGLCPYDMNKNYMDILFYHKIDIPINIENKVVQLENGELTFCVYPRYQYRKESFSIGFAHYIIWKFNSAIDMEEIKRNLYIIVDFFSVLAGENVTVNSLNCTESNKMVEVIGICNFPKEKLNVLKNDTMDSISFKRSSLYKITDFQNLEQAMKYWFSNYRKIYNAQQAYGRILLDEDVKIVTINKFLAAMQLIEGYTQAYTDEEKEIKEFTPTEYWTINASITDKIKASLDSYLDKKIEIQIVDSKVTVGKDIFNGFTLSIGKKTIGEIADMAGQFAIIKNGNVDSLYKKLEKAVEILIENYNLNK